MILLNENLFSCGAEANADADGSDAEAKLNEVIECVGGWCVKAGYDIIQYFSFIRHSIQIVIDMN